MTRPAAARASAAVASLALAVVLSLDWFGPAGGLTGPVGDAAVSGWTGLSPFSVAFLVVAAVATVAGRGIVAVAVCVIALAILLVDLLTLPETVALRWPAYTGLALAADLLLSATWAWRASAAPVS